MSIKMTRTQFLEWARQRTQTTENEFLAPHNRDIADSEDVEVISWENFVSLFYQMDEGRIEIIKEDKK